MNRPNQGGGSHAAERQDPGRSVAEWVTLGISVAIVVGVVLLVIYASLRGDDDPATIEVQPQLDQIRQVQGAYYLPVMVTNRGDRTAEDVQVHLSLTGGTGEPPSTQFTVRFLAGGERADAVVVFREDPSQGTLTTTISFIEP